MNGYIKLHRSMLDWEWYENPNVKAVFLHLLLNASFVEKTWRGFDIKAGQVVCSLQSISKQCGISIQSVRTSLKKLESTGEITSESTNRYRVVTLTNWNKYQVEEPEASTQSTNQRTPNQQATNKQLTSNQQHRKNVKKERKEECKEEKESATRSRFTPPSIEEVTFYCTERNNAVDAQQFIDFYASKGWKVGNTPMKDWKACIRTWEKRDGRSQPSSRASPKAHYNPFLEELRKEGVVL